MTITNNTLTQIHQYLEKIDTELNDQQAPKWGQMNAQNMVEHLSLLFIASIGKWGKEFKGDKERAAKQKANFFSVKYPFPKGVAMPGTSKGQAPPPLQGANMAASKVLLKESFQKYLAHFDANPTDKIQHPYFGMLSFEEWSLFHLRHIEHHSMQFDLLEEPLTPEMEKLIAEIGQKLQVLYQDLTDKNEAKWGLMNAHQCVEHLNLVFLYSTGKFGVPFKGNIEAARSLWLPFKLSANPWKTVFPTSPLLGKPKPTRTDTIEAAKKALKKTFIKYTHYCKENPIAITPHGFLGDISTAQWLLVHSKHIDHHLSQFGVIPELV